MDYNAYAYLLVGLFFAVVIFVALREGVLWYFRINQIADDLHSIAEHYRRVDGTIRPTSPQSYSNSGAGSPFSGMGRAQEKP